MSTKRAQKTAILSHFLQQRVRVNPLKRRGQKKPKLTLNQPQKLLKIINKRSRNSLISPLNNQIMWLQKTRKMNRAKNNPLKQTRLSRRMKIRMKSRLLKLRNRKKRQKRRIMKLNLKKNLPKMKMRNLLKMNSLMNRLKKRKMMRNLLIASLKKMNQKMKYPKSSLWWTMMMTKLMMKTWMLI